LSLKNLNPDDLSPESFERATDVTAGERLGSGRRGLVKLIVVVGIKEDFHTIYIISFGSLAL
jgi:hypothetical protein